MTESDAEERATTCPHDGVAPRRNLGLQPKRPVSRHGLARFLSISEDVNPDLSFGDGPSTFLIVCRFATSAGWRE
jgi:hypothetical protein